MTILYLIIKYSDSKKITLVNLQKIKLMTKVTIKETQNPAILKFEFPDFITQNENFEFKNIDEAGASPLAQQLFYLPFVKTVYISGNFIAVERFSIVEWEDVKEAVAEQIEKFVNDGGIIIKQDENKAKKQPITVYGETTPNPSALKFVVSKMLTRTAVEFKNIDQTASSPLAKELFKFPFVKEIFIDENYISVTKYDINNWDEITLELRSFIKQFIENGGTVLEENFVQETLIEETKKTEEFDNLDVTSQKIINILEEYVKPAVAADGGNIAFESFDEENKVVKVILQGACSGCPSSTFTLKSGIEGLLKSMLNDDTIVVEAANA
jgi:Fe-S cluster biogenesis protein NfuA